MDEFYRELIVKRLAVTAPEFGVCILAAILAAFN